MTDEELAATIDIIIDDMVDIAKRLKTGNADAVAREYNRTMYGQDGAPATGTLMLAHAAINKASTGE